MPRAFPHQLAWLLDNPLRALLLSPSRLADRLPLREASRVLEVGPGPGFYSRELARRIPQGELVLLDLQPEMLAKARGKLEAGGHTNVTYLVSPADAAWPLGEASIDVAVLVAVLGEVPEQEKALANLRRVLRPDGVLAIHEGIPDPDRIPIARLTRLVREAGFQPWRRYGPRWNYTALFRL